MREREKFLRRLKDEPIGRDCFDNELFPGDIIIYAVNVGQSPVMKVGKIVDVVESNSSWRGPALKLRGATKDVGYYDAKQKTYVRFAKPQWVLQKVVRFQRTVKACHLWENPDETLVKLFNDAEENAK